MNHLGPIEDFITQINSSKSLDTIFASLHNHINRLGFEKFVYELTWGDENRKLRPLFITSYPQAYINHYIDRRYASDDLACRYSAQLVRPFAWSDITSKNKVTQRQRLVFNEAAEAGLRSGGIVPIHGPGSIKAYVGVAGDMPEYEFIKLFNKRKHELHLMATYAHEKIIDLNVQTPPTTSVQMSPREIEIMSWIARGKTKSEISDILDISEDTVKSHVKNVCGKLQASNKAHAVALALIHGLISL